MESLIAFNIPLSGMKVGLHQFEYKLDKQFFQEFPGDLIEDAVFDVKVGLEKKTSLIVVNFDFDGHLNTPCDRCMEDIKLPVKDSSQLLFKYSHEPKDEDEVVYIPYDLAVLNIAKYIYESIGLCLPLIKTYDCENDENRVCNDEILDYLHYQNDISGATDAPEQDSNPGNPIWDELKNKMKNE